MRNFLFGLRVYNDLLDGFADFGEALSGARHFVGQNGITVEVVRLPVDDETEPTVYCTVHPVAPNSYRYEFANPAEAGRWLDRATGNPCPNGQYLLQFS